MRIQAYSLMSLMTFAGVAAAGFIGACGGKVVVDGSNPTGAGGSGGSGGGIMTTSGPQTTSGPIITGPAMTAAQTVGASVTTGPMTSGSDTSGSTMDVSVGPGPGASSSTGGVNACDDACSKASMCGFDFCSQFGVNCQNPPMQAQCPLKCIAAASCGDIQKLAMQNFATPLGACILGCQGGGSSGGGQASVGSGPPPPPMACQQCTLQHCTNSVVACNAKKGPGSCSQWLQCAQGCNDSMCLFGCDNQFPNAAPQYDAVYSCLCNNCDASCPNDNACGHVMPMPPSGSGP